MEEGEGEEQKPHLVRNLIYLAISIVNLVFICRIFVETKNNPFDSEQEEDKIFYFNDNFNSNLPLSSTLKQCKCGQNILNDFCTEEQILSGCTDISFSEKINNQKFLRFLMSEKDCLEIKDNIINNNKTLNQIFDTKIKTIHNISIGLLVVAVVNLCPLLIILSTVDLNGLCDFCFICCIPFLPIILCSICFSLIVDLILFIIITVDYFQGDTKRYNDFLNCSFVSKDGFDKYKDLEKLKTDFIVFMIINILYMIFNSLFMNCKCKIGNQ